MKMANNAQNKNRHMRAFQRFWMDLGRIVITPYYLYLRMRVYDLQKRKCKQKLKGGALILANHSSFCDPLYVSRMFWYRRVHFMTADVVMKKPIVRILLSGMGCVPINREGYDIQAIKRIVALAKSGETIAIFPQGGLHRDNEMQEIKNGALLIALQAGVPLVPVYTQKRKHFLHKQIAVIGEALQIDTKMPSMAQLNQYSEELLHRMQKCKEIYKEITEEQAHA